jgi:hypothetical protein
VAGLADRKGRCPITTIVSLVSLVWLVWSVYMLVVVGRLEARVEDIGELHTKVGADLYGTINRLERRVMALEAKEKGKEGGK